MMAEEWAAVAGLESRYEVSNLGRIRSPRKILATCKNPNGYATICLKLGGGKRRTAMVHRLVAKAFLPPPEFQEAQVNHRDGVKHHNFVTNLEWCSSSENNRHAFATGLKSPTDVHGERNPRAKITAADAENIRQMRGVLSQRQLAKRYGIGRSAVQWIQNGKNWATAGLRVREMPQVTK